MIDPPVSKNGPPGPFRTLLRYNLPYWKAYAAGSVLSLIFILVSLVNPLVLRWIVQDLESGRLNVPLLWQYFGLLLAISIGAGFARYFQRTLMIGASRRFEYDLRNDLFQHLLRLSARFFNRSKTGDLMARATNDINYIREFVGPGVMGTVDMVRIPFTLAIMFHLSTKLTLYSMAPLPFISIFVYLCIRYINRQTRIVQELFSKLSARAQENLAGARVVKAFGLAARETSAFETASTEYMRANVKLVAFSSFAFPLIGMMVGVVLLTVIWQGGTMVIHDELTLGDLTAFILYMILLAWPLAQFGWILTLYQRGAAGMKRVGAILNESADIQNPETHAPALEIASGRIQFHKVGFAYNGSTVLEDISFEVEPGQTLAIVGPTGSGKSTIIALLTRVYDPTTGEISLDGHGLRDIPLDTLREAMGLVPQDTFIFSDTIRNNIAMADESADEERLLRASQTAQFMETAEALPQSFDTLLGERGINLSGGQKQRLTLARALYRDPRILVLDDALSSVDAKTEADILEALHEVMSTRTNVVVTHRLSTIRTADQILVIEGGRITERGRHEELVTRDGLYAAIYRRQMLESALEEVP